MSKIDEVIKKLEKYIMDDNVPADRVGTGIVHDILLDDDFDMLAAEYPELGLIADYGSNMEYESKATAEELRREVRELFIELKRRLKQ